jgi:hypothetical protein
MHVHPSQTTPTTQMDALYAAQKAAAKREAEGIRKKLLEFAPEAGGEEEDSVVRLGAKEDSEEEEKGNGRREGSGGKKQEKDADAEDEGFISDWA